VRREDWDRRYAKVENLWSAKPNRFLVAEVAELEPGRALDLACGEGQNAIWLASRAWKVRGVDYSAVAIAKARARAEREGVEVDFVEADLVRYEPDAAAYDLVLLLYLHISVEERRNVHARAARAVAPGGTLLLLGHHLRNLTEGVGGPSDPSLLYTPDEIVAELNGLVAEKAQPVYRDVDNADRPAIDVLVRASRSA
jgi:SAM-dependent methyltransferase